MMIITFDPYNGPTWPDGVVIDEMRIKLLYGEDFTIGSENAFCAVRYLFLEEGFNDLDITFVYNGQTTKMNKYGNPVDWFRGMADMTARLCERAILKQCDMRKKERAIKEAQLKGEHITESVGQTVTFHPRIKYENL